MKKINLSSFPQPGDRYHLESCLGNGSFAQVFQATDHQANDKKVAIKTITITSNNTRFVEQEYRILRDLSNHANIPDFYGVFGNGNSMWFVMELCEGGPVTDLVDGLLVQNRRMSEEHIAYILKETVKALIFLHEQHVLHGNVKGRNIVLKSGEVKLVDFLFSTSTKKENSTLLGSPCWMAPELVLCKRNAKGYDNKIDVWAVGMTAIEIGDGKAPNITMHPSRILSQIVTNPPPTLLKPCNWSENFTDFVNECLTKNPEHRPYMIEIIEHPFLTEVPENNYHLTLELKSLCEDMMNVSRPKPNPEVIVYDKNIKKGLEHDWEPMLVEDLADLDKITEKTVFKEVEDRLKTNASQTFIGDILLVLNPPEPQEIYTEQDHQKYVFKSRSDNAPHIFSVADGAYQSALHHATPQKIILSGESGSGKTRNYLHLLEHLLFLGQSRNINLERIHNAVKLIHALTHASTPINEYSTRCVFQTELKFGKTGKVSGANFKVNQIEKWRISSIDMSQGNFHILYYLFDGLKAEGKSQRYCLNPETNYRYLRLNGKPTSPELNAEKFYFLTNILQDFQLTDEEIDTIYSILAAVLITGEVRIIPLEDNSCIVDNKDSINKLGDLLGIDPKKFEWALTNYFVRKKDCVIRKKSTADEARDARDVFAENLYIRLMDFVLYVINQKLSVGSKIFGDKYSIKIFDYFGFECFKSNHISQLFVNCFNEQLHYHYLQRVFSWESLEAHEENLQYTPVDYYGNKRTLDEILGKAEGLFTIIDQCSKKGLSPEYINDALEELGTKHLNPEGTHLFSIAHFTGKVTYNAKEMPDKNRDFLPAEVVETLRLSQNPIIKMLFTNKLDNTGNVIFKEVDPAKLKRSQYASMRPRRQYSQIFKKRTTINSFKAFCLDLLKELSIGGGAGGAHFVRCIRSNISGNINKQLIRQQLRAMAVTQTAKVRRDGFSHRISFAEFLKRYQFLAFDFDENVEITKDNCRLLLVRLKMEGWQIGKSKVFLKHYNEEYLSKLYEIYVKKIIKIQSMMRGYLAKLRIKSIVKKNEEVVEKKPLCKREMSEEEAANVIQRAYRINHMRKTSSEVLDNDTCNFIIPFATKWKKNSLFSVLLKYRAMKYHESFHLSQQVHFYNIAVFYKLQEANEPVELENVDTKAQLLSWFGEPKPAVTKIPFRLDEIPFCDTSPLCNLLSSSASSEKTDSWDRPYRHRELSSFKADLSQNSKPDEHLINLPFCRDPEETIPEVEPEDEEPKSRKNLQNQKIFEEKPSTSSNRRMFRKIASQLSESREDELKINSNAQPANKDFDYIKPPPTNRPKQIDPIHELTEKSRFVMNNRSEDDPPFNFQGMLRKTNFQRESVKKAAEQGNSFTFQRKQLRNQSLDTKCNGTTEICEKKVCLEIAPGLILEGVEVEL